MDFYVRFFFKTWLCYRIFVLFCYFSSIVVNKTSSLLSAVAFFSLLLSVSQFYFQPYCLLFQKQFVLYAVNVSATSIEKSFCYKSTVVTLVQCITVAYFNIKSIFWDWFQPQCKPLLISMRFV